ncbi:MAG: helix-turn-helix transcriptional regulator [Clostridia bacterium]|nr:helix-turn-helix transcriptional regulator [Clostridia bacterium]
MVTDKFPKNLATLRKENGINQKTAASKLGVSQALLSHYEKGIREPGFDFLLRAAEYYNCSADYLLGRTNDKRGIAYIPEEYTADSEDEYPLSEINRITASVKTVSNLLIHTDNEPLLVQALEYLKISLYRLTRQLSFGSKIDTEHFKLSFRASEDLSRAMLALCEDKIGRLIPHIKPELPAAAATVENIEGWKALSAIISETEDLAEQLEKLDILKD